MSLSVTPTPSDAQITPSAPCTPIEPIINVCAFGVPAPAATGTVALVGDSHAGHWRASLEVVAQAMGWRGLSITMASCMFTAATMALPEPRRSQCAGWTQGVLQWFARHPEVSTVFMSDHHGAVLVPPGQSPLAAQAAGYVSVWNALPASVKHIIVIRDNPYVRDGTLGCVQKAIDRRQRAGIVCALPRSAALQVDPQVVAAAQLRSPRVQVIDLTRFFCDSRLCYPVVGGVLVYKDATHVTRVFATSLGPFLLHQVGQLLASWYPQKQPAPPTRVLPEPAPTPRCFGAAATDPRHPCENPRLRYSVVPTPMEALATPDAPCAPTEQDAALNVCSFGVAQAAGATTIALLGDSHASDERAAVEVLAQAQSWRGLSITRPDCSFSEAIQSLPEPGRSRCLQWTRAVILWFKAHPAVSTVFVGADARGSVTARRGHDLFLARMAGYVQAWKALPASVRHIIVIRDTPQVGQRALDCVRQAIASRAPAGLACGVPRRAALASDPAAAAAARLRSGRVQVVDFTRHLCTPRLCYPVIGGALVYKDGGGHLTRVFDTTLGPFILGQVGALMKSWGSTTAPPSRPSPGGTTTGQITLPVA